MGCEAANVHLGSRREVKNVLRDLRNRKRDWLRTPQRKWRGPLNENGRSSQIEAHSRQVLEPTEYTDLPPSPGSLAVLALSTARLGIESRLQFFANR